MSGSREAILTAIRRGLAVPSPPPPMPDPPLDEWFPPLREEELVSVFSDALRALQGEVMDVADEAAAGRRVASLLADLDPGRAWVQPDLPFAPVREAVDGKTNVASFSSQEMAKEKLEDAQAGITDALCFIARHGTIFLGAPTQGGRLLSFLPEHHIVVGRRAQVVADLADAFAIARERFGDAWPSFLTLITGSSRTADIEKILVLGAHGPRKLSVVLF